MTYPKECINNNCKNIIHVRKEDLVKPLQCPQCFYTKQKNLMRTCNYEIAWVGSCGKPTVEGKSKCEKHIDIKCVSCGEPATGECNETFQLVCGYPLCNNCGHYDKENKYKHCKKPKNE